MPTIGDLLRQWRHRRRLSQLDLALAAGVSARHVSLIETGKTNPSAAMVLRLADHLAVPLRERNRLLLAAGFAPRYPERPLDDEALAAAGAAVARVLRAHEPYPAVAFDRRWNILRTNRAVEPFFAGVDPALLRPPVNLVRLGLDPRGFAPLVVNLDDVRTVFRARIRRQLALAPDPELTALYDELLAPGAADPPDQDPDPAGPGPAVASDVVIPMVLRVAGRELRLFSTITTFGTPVDITLAEVAIESYYPADAETAAYFEEPGGRPRPPAPGPAE
ncbi:transcriptional regulator [Streptomyces sp. WAC 06738]|uniref:helix-turn-helix domain-containing protein n=1 Tax=Streptomyces sp. WAC 06738 TaxID=2203210 RepID=UPI000F7077E0|nr:helix-turn-helix transcriptional regulator [Streptomyces sp. WAC 06738]AZM47074.1 transcriptional regulator [Streptomyces sp. WAC 06738]